MHEALQENEVVDIYEDDLAALAEDDAFSGNQKDNGLSEYQSFTDMNFSRQKVVSAVQWLLHRKVTACLSSTIVSET
jgi:dynein intermediate chain 3, axonemal